MCTQKLTVRQLYLVDRTKKQKRRLKTKTDVFRKKKMVTVKVHGVSTPEGGRMTVVEVFVDNNTVFLYL